MKTLGNELAIKAKKAGICEDWFKELKTLNDNHEKLLEMYIKGIDFCLSNDFPSNDIIQKYFKGKMEHKGIHLDEIIDLVNMPKVILLGNCTGHVGVFEYSTCELFIKHNSEIELFVEGNSFVMVDMFDQSKLSVFASDNAKVCINRYSGNNILETESEGNSIIKIIEKNTKTYVSNQSGPVN